MTENGTSEPIPRRKIHSNYCSLSSLRLALFRTDSKKSKRAFSSWRPPGIFLFSEVLRSNSSKQVIFSPYPDSAERQENSLLCLEACSFRPTETGLFSSHLKTVGSAVGKPDTALQKVCSIFPLSMAYAFVLGAARTFHRERGLGTASHTLSSWISGASSAKTAS